MHHGCHLKFSTRFNTRAFVKHYEVRASLINRPRVSMYRKAELTRPVILAKAMLNKMIRRAHKSVRFRHGRSALTATLSPLKQM